jgi:UDP-2-acetamido-2-deoxy-ribo-hexuluronate aminotransferase
MKQQAPITNKKSTNTPTIDFANLQYQYQLYKTEIDEAIQNVLNKSNYIMGDEVRELENNLQNFTGASHAITCSSGTDALLLAMMALDIKPGDEIITTPFTFIATAETIAFLGAKPVFVDIDEKTYNIDTTKIEEKITDKTKAIIAVSLYGQPCDIDALEQLKIKHSKLKIIIDGAQSFGSTYKGRTDSNLGDISTTSFFPAKPLGCFGDGGAVFTNSDELAEKMKSLRVHGQSKRYHHKYIGMGGRMDTLQCAIVDVKLKHYEKDLALRQEVAEKYTKALNDKDLILPFVDERATSAFAQYSIRVKNRDNVQAKLKEQGIPTAVHYPMPLHLQECFAYLGYKEGDFPIAEKVSNEIMSLPMNPYVSDEEIEYVCKRL